MHSALCSLTNSWFSQESIQQRAREQKGKTTKQHTNETALRETTNTDNGHDTALVTEEMRATKSNHTPGYKTCEKFMSKTFVHGQIKTHSRSQLQTQLQSNHSAN